MYRPSITDMFAARRFRQTVQNDIDTAEVVTKTDRRRAAAAREIVWSAERRAARATRSHRGALHAICWGPA